MSYTTFIRIVSVRDYITIFDNLTLRCDMTTLLPDHARFCSGLRSDIRHAMLISSYHMELCWRSFSFSFRARIIFQRDFISKVREQCSKCEGYEHYDYQCPSKSRHVNVVPSDNVDDSRIIDDVYVPSRLLVSLMIYQLISVPQFLMRFMFLLGVLVMLWMLWSLVWPYMLLGIHLSHLW